jgi:hypothetical protein
MGGASYPKGDGERRNRAERQFDWSVLPMEGRDGPPPALPAWREWTSQTLAWWAELWATPQATMWDQSGRSMHTLALLHHELMTDASNAAKVSAEMRQHEDRHGLTPKAMLQLRWRISSQPAVAAPGEGKVIHLVPRPDPADMPGKRARKADWVAWAVAWGADRSAAEKLTKAQLVREFSSVSPSAPSPAVPGKRPASKAAQRLQERTRR